MIWGITLKPGEVWTKTVDCEEYLTLASLECRQRKNNGELNPSASLIVLIKGEEHLLCTLEKGSVLQQKLDLQLSEAVTFMVEGTGIVYITGYSTVQSPQPYHESPSICTNDSTAEDSQRQWNNKLLKEQPVTSVKNEQTGDANNNSWNEYYKNFMTHEVGETTTVTASQGVSSSDGNILTVKIPRVRVTRLKQGSWDISGRVNNKGNFDPLIPPEENSVTEKDSNPREQMDVSGGDLLGTDEDLQMSMTTASLPPDDEDEMWILASSDEEETTSTPQVGDICDMSPMDSQYQWQSDDGWCSEEPSTNDNEFTDVNSPLATGVAADSSDKEDENNRADSLEEMSSKGKGLRELESVLRADKEPLKLIIQDHQCGEQEYGRTSDEKYIASKSELLKTELQLSTTISSGCHGNLGDSTDNQSDSTTVKDDNSFRDKAPIIDTFSTPQRALKSMPEELTKASVGVRSSFQKNITRGRPTGKSRKTLAVQRKNANKNKECPNAEDNLSTRNPFPCQHCVENFADEDLLADHERTHSMNLAAKMNQGDSSQKPLGHSDQNQNLVRSRQTHAKAKHKCGYCDRVYNSYNDLQKHEILHRAEEKQDKFWCRLCDSAFKTRGSFLNHTKVHTSNRRKGKQKMGAKKKYKCSFCGKLLSVKSHWIEHERTHTGEKTFNCRICDRAFSLARIARYHETMVHARQLASLSRNETSTVWDNLFVPSSAVAMETSGRSANGSSASSGTDTAESLDLTLSSNSEKDKMPSLTADKTKASSVSQNPPMKSQLKNKHTCCFCPSSFATKQRLWSHIEYHRVEHSYKCSYCQRLCPSESARKIHERSHTGERPFKCKLCTKSFIRKFHLKRHLKTVPHPEADLLNKSAGDFLHL